MAKALLVHPTIVNMVFVVAVESVFVFVAALVAVEIVVVEVVVVVNVVVDAIGIRRLSFCSDFETRRTNLLLLLRHLLMHDMLLHVLRMLLSHHWIHVISFHEGFLFNSRLLLRHLLMHRLLLLHRRLLVRHWHLKLLSRLHLRLV